MNPLIGLAQFTRDQAERLNVAALQFGVSWPISVGTRRYTLTFEPCRRRYPLRLRGNAAGEPFELDIEAGALMPALCARGVAQTGPLAHQFVADACTDWLCAIEGLFGLTLAIDSVSYDAEPEPGAYGLALTHQQSGRAANFSFRCQAVDGWLRSRAPAPATLHALARQIIVSVPVCIAGPALSFSRVRNIRAGDALVLDRRTHFLHLPLRDGAQRILLKQSGDRMMIDRPLVDEQARQHELSSEFIPIDALTFTFDAMIGSLRLSLFELSRLRSGSLVSLQLSVRERAVTLLCQGVPFARGELVDIDDVLAVRITSIVQPAQEDKAP
ncbi:FliM/FliN family flagellar motor switch protein [Paraburkholderia bannensis]|uniref:FliM/FliN family flagellar motor switch protein n=1 Tax=Paraburkholderia bannensis TaxID=765414 RepID=UPI002AB762B8|nr:FliM/FliN family flagellar motor switch protein [Paraburkholderia bannensis]